MRGQWFIITAVSIIASLALFSLSLTIPVELDVTEPARVSEGFYFKNFAEELNKTVNYCLIDSLDCEREIKWFIAYARKKLAGMGYNLVVKNRTSLLSFPIKFYIELSSERANISQVFSFP